MSEPVVIDASAGVEILARTATEARLRQLIPDGAVPWVPDGLFDAEVLSVLRRWELRSVLTTDEAAAASHRLTVWPLRRAAAAGRNLNRPIVGCIVVEQRSPANHAALAMSSHNPFVASSKLLRWVRRGHRLPSEQRHVAPTARTGS